MRNVITLSIPMRLTAAGCEATGGHTEHCSFCNQCSICGAALPGTVLDA